MPYDSVTDIPDYVPKDSREKWITVFNAAWKSKKKSGATDKKAEEYAFAVANSRFGPDPQKMLFSSELEKTTEEPSFELFMPFTKMDAAKREVYGVLTAEKPDKTGETLDYERSKPYFKAWSGEISKATYDPENPGRHSLGNVREMHRADSAAGKLTNLEFDDARKEIRGTAKIIDDAAWEKCATGVYTGFSIGGKYVGGKPVGGGRYVANPSETSVVDNPALPDAHFSYVKEDGSTEIRKFIEKSGPKKDKTKDDDNDKDKEPDMDDDDDGEIDAYMKSLDGVALPSCPCLECATPAEMTKEDQNYATHGGEKVPRGKHAWAPAGSSPSEWKYPIDKPSRVRNAIARWGQHKGIPAEEEPKVARRIIAAARRMGIDVSDDAPIREAAKKTITNLLTGADQSDTLRRNDGGKDMTAEEVQKMISDAMALEKSKKRKQMEEAARELGEMTKAHVSYHEAFGKCMDKVIKGLAGDDPKDDFHPQATDPATAIQSTETKHPSQLDTPQDTWKAERAELQKSIDALKTQVVELTKNALSTKGPGDRSNLAEVVEIRKTAPDTLLKSMQEAAGQVTKETIEKAMNGNQDAQIAVMKMGGDAGDSIPGVLLGRFNARIRRSA